MARNTRRTPARGRRPAAPRRPGRPARRTRPAGPARWGDEPRAADRAAQLGALLYRYRWQLAPVGVGVAVFGAGAAARVSLPVPLVVLLALLGNIAVYLAARRAFPRVSERVYAQLVAGVAGGWIVAAAAAGATRPPLPGLWLFGTVALAIPWWAHRRVRDHIVADRAQEAWPAIAEAVGLAGTKLRQYRVDGSDWTAVLQLRAGHQTWEDVKSAAARLESALRVRPGALRVTRDRKRADRAMLAVVHDDVFDEAPELLHPATVGDGGDWQAGARSILDPVPIGVEETGAEITVRVVDEKIGAHHGLLGGMKGSGKSGVMSDLIAGVARTRDAVMFGIDLHKGGRVFAPWEPCMEKIITTMDEAKALAAALNEIITDRAEQGAAAGDSDKTRPTPDLPAFVVWVDEAARLLGADDLDAVPLFRDLAQGGRSEAVSLWLATQRPTLASLGDGDLRAQLDTNIGLRMRAGGDVKFVFPDHHDQLDTSLFRVPGMVYVQDDPHVTPRPGRSWALYDPKTVRKVAQRLAPGRPRPDARAAAILANHLGGATPRTSPRTAASTAAGTGPGGELVDAGNNRRPTATTAPTAPGAAGNAERREQLQRQLADIVDQVQHDRPLPAVRLDELCPPAGPSSAAGALDTAAAAVLDEIRAAVPAADMVDAKIIATIRAAGAEGAQMRSIVDAAELHRTTVNNRLKPLMQAGLVTKPRQGWYTAPEAA